MGSNQVQKLCYCTYIFQASVLYSSVSFSDDFVRLVPTFENRCLEQFVGGASRETRDVSVSVNM